MSLVVLPPTDPTLTPATDRGAATAAPTGSVVLAAAEHDLVPARHGGSSLALGRPAGRLVVTEIWRIRRRLLVVDPGQLGGPGLRLGIVEVGLDRCLVAQRV